MRGHSIALLGAPCHQRLLRLLLRGRLLLGLQELQGLAKHWCGALQMRLGHVRKGCCESEVLGLLALSSEPGVREVRMCMRCSCGGRKVWEQPASGTAVATGSQEG